MNALADWGFLIYDMIKINEELKALIPPLTTKEYETLEQSIINEGCRDALIVWNDTIVDGHNRYSICQKHNLEFTVNDYDFTDIEQVKDWMDANQLGRRNLTDDQRKIIIGRRYNREKKKQGGRSDRNLSGSQNDHPKTSEKLAKENKVSPKTITRYANDAEYFENLEKDNPEVAKDIWEGKTKLANFRKKQEKEQKQKEREEQQEKARAYASEIIKQQSKTDLEKGWHKIGNQFLYYGSNLDDDFISFLPAAKFAFADPPYNAGVDDWDKDFIWQNDYLQDVADVVAVTPGGWNAYGFYRTTEMQYIWEMCCWITNGMTHGKCGYANFIKASIFGKVKPKIKQDFFKITIKTSETSDTAHKGRKPYDFMLHLINTFTDKNDVIVDPFAGSGTTLLLSELNSRVSYNAEIDKGYCLDIINRLIEKKANYERI